MDASSATFEEFVLARQHRLLSVAYLLTRDLQRAEDLVQEALVKAYLRWDRGPGIAQPDAYVRRIVVNEFISGRRRRSASEQPTDTADLIDVAAPSKDPDEQLAMWRALGVLTPRERAVLVLRYYEGFTDREIADHLGCAEGTVRSLATRAYAALRAQPGLLDRAKETS